MSLLNDALRDLEKREGTGEGNQASIPAGLNAAGYRAPMYWRWTLGGSALVLAVLAGAGFWWFNGSDPAPGKQGAVSSMSSDPKPVIRTVKPEPEASASPELPESASPDAIQSAATGDETISPGPEKANSGSDDEAQGETAKASGQRAEAVATRDGDEEATTAAPQEPETTPREPSAEATSPETVAGDEPDSETEPATATVRELTPAEKDRRLARELEALLGDGRVARAREKLRQRALLDSDAPRSRAVMARHAMARENPGDAKQWLPSEAVALDPGLRLLRARVALAQEGRARALEWLEAEPPGAATMPAYHTMMAALYQQTGNHDAAAEQWAALIEADDSNARWWAGLGIALEAQGSDERARAAYSQALSLPDLAPQLRRYIEQRLAAEQG